MLLDKISTKRAVAKPAYLDNAATTRLDPRVFEAMTPFFCERFGNSGSRVYGRGLDAEEAVQAARWQVAALLGARPVEIIFTSGATESNNLALSGLADSWGGVLDLVVSEIEHPSVMAVARRLAARGARLRLLPVGPDGRVNPDDLRRILADPARGPQVLVSVMHANNETGTVNPVAEIGSICREYGAVFHCDATQSVGKVPVDMAALQVDLLSFSGHKIYGPKGVGALYVRHGGPGSALTPLTVGGGQERGLRSGTLNVPGIVGLGAAAELAAAGLASEATELRRLSELLVACLSNRLDGVRVNGSFTHRVPGLVNLRIGGVSAEQLQQTIKSVVEVSVGSACSTGDAGPSPVLTALCLSREQALTSIRLTLGRFTTEDEIHLAMDAIVPVAQRLMSEN